MLLKKGEVKMAHSSKGVLFQLNEHCPGCYKVTLTIPQKLTSKLYAEAVLAQEKETETYGFSKGKTPKYYIEQNYKTNLAEHLKSFLFHYFALSGLYKNICEKKIILANEPELESIELDDNNDARFSFLIDTVNDIEKGDWKNIQFKAPQRKNYKDIDRQVETFLEQEVSSDGNSPEEIAVGDWVCFDISLLSSDKDTIFEDLQETLWIKISNEEVDKEMRTLLVGKKVGDIITTQAQTLQEYFSDKIDTQYTFVLQIQAIAAHTLLALENIKKHFTLKTSKDLHRKLIEVYSFRNDISQRRETIEKLFKQLIGFYKFKPRPFLIEQQEMRVLEAVQRNPDYYVYKSQKNFKQIVHQLAERQLKEMIIIDLISGTDNIKANLEDVTCYLTLTQRARTNMFVYFGIPSTKVKGQEMPVPHSVVEHIVLREKTLNHIIHTLTRKK
ncbi:MAG: trigger factor [Bacteroidota bacterium]